MKALVLALTLAVPVPANYPPPIPYVGGTWTVNGTAFQVVQRGDQIIAQSEFTCGQGTVDQQGNVQMEWQWSGEPMAGNYRTICGRLCGIWTYGDGIEHGEIIELQIRR